ncbi:hypothetical protein SRHO_G00048960 [Serrasalmus rhombeus]
MGMRTSETNDALLKFFFRLLFLQFTFASKNQSGGSSKCVSLLRGAAGGADRNAGGVKRPPLWVPRGGADPCDCIPEPSEAERRKISAPHRRRSRQELRGWRNDLLLASTSTSASGDAINRTISYC